MTPPLVSTVIAVFNGAKTITRALNSIAAQTYPNIEIICVEDGSTDNTLSILKTWQQEHQDIPVTILQNQKNSGLAASLNKGIKVAKGEYIARIDADDQWLPTKIDKQIDFLIKHPKHGIIGSFYINVREQKQQHIRLPITDTDIKRSMFRRNPFGHSCIVIHKDLLEQTGGYNGKLREDRDLWFRLLHHTQFHNLPEFLAIRDISVSHFTSSKELHRNIRTVHTYIKKYKAPLTTYIWLLEPIAVYLYHSVKKYVQR